MLVSPPPPIRTCPRQRHTSDEDLPVTHFIMIFHRATFSRLALTRSLTMSSLFSSKILGVVDFKLQVEYRHSWTRPIHSTL